MVVFSALNTPPGKFLGIRVFSELDCSIVFINCESNSWYLSGVPGLGQCYKESANSLHDLCVAIAGEAYQATYYGGSMGGYGALLYGCYNNVELVVATGVEFELCLPLGNAINHINKPSYNPIYNVVSNSDTKCFVIYGQLFLADLFCANQAFSRINRNGFEIYTIPFVGHSVPGIIENRVGLKVFIDDIVGLNQLELDWLIKAEKDFFDNVPLLYEIASCCNDECGESDLSDKISLILLNEMNPSLLYMLHYYAGEYFRIKGDGEKSKQHFYSGNKINNEAYLCHLGLARTLQKEGDANGAIKEAIISIDSMDIGTLQVDFNAFIFVSKILLSKGDYLGALQYLERILKYRPQNRPARDMLKNTLRFRLEQLD